jgi:hypothetical protein
MLSKTIVFQASEEYLDAKLDLPIPAKKNIPEWFKNLKHNHIKKTVKGCVPFLDSLSTGYLIKMPVDLEIKHNIINNKTGLRDGGQLSSVGALEKDVEDYNIGLNTKVDFHKTFQLEGSPLLEKNKNLPLHKILNPWTIKTPSGYSCLFTPPFNNKDDRFEILVGIVDTDTYNLPVNFPIVINGDKYNELNTVIKKGTVIAQVIPFKRDNWKMEIKKLKNKEIKINRISLFSQFINGYRDRFWSKKTWL